MLKIRKAVPFTVGDFLEGVANWPKTTPLWAGVCEVCFNVTIAGQGPLAQCQSCKAEIQVKPMTKKPREAKPPKRNFWQKLFGE